MQRHLGVVPAVSALAAAAVAMQPPARLPGSDLAGL